MTEGEMMSEMDGGKLTPGEMEAMGEARPADVEAAERLREMDERHAREKVDPVREVPPPKAAMIIAYGENLENSKHVLYVALNEDAMGVLRGKEPVLYAVPGVPGMEDWELVVIGPEGVAPFLVQVQSVVPEGD